MNQRLLLLTAVAAALAAYAGWQYLGGGDDASAPVHRSGTANPKPVPATAQGGPGKPAGGQPLASTAPTPSGQLLPPLQSYEVIWERPLFTASRKAAAQIRTPRTVTNNPAPRQNTASGPPDFKVMGVAIGPEGGAALIRLSARETVRVLKGDEVDGWTVEELSPTTVTFSRGRDRWQVPVGADD